MITWAYGLFLITTILIFFYDRIKYKRVWYDPLYGFLFVMLMYVSPLPIRYMYNLPIESGITPYFYDIADIFPLTLFITNIALIIFYITYLFAPTFKWNSKLFNTDKHDYFILHLISIIMFLLSIVILFVSSKQFGGIKSLLLMGYGITSVTSQHPIISISINAMVASSFLMMSAFSISRKKYHLLLSIIMILLPFILLIITARRAELVVFIGAYIIFYSLSIRIIPFKILLPIAIFFFLFLTVLGYSRLTDDKKSAYDNLGSVVHRFNKQLVGFGKHPERVFYTVTQGQFAIPYETLPILMKYKANDPPLLGATLGDIFVQWIPRAIYPEKDYGLAVWYYHEFYDADAPSNKGRTFFFLSEGYLNFGIMGIFIWAALWGLFWKNIAILIKYKNLLFYFIYSIYVASMIILINNYSVALFTTIIKSYIIWFMLPYLFYLTIIYIKNRNRITLQ